MDEQGYATEQTKDLTPLAKLLDRERSSLERRLSLQDKYEAAV